MILRTQVAGARSVRSSIVRLVELIVEEGVANCDDAGIRNGLWGQASNLSDLLLDSLKMHVDSVENPTAYAQARHDVHTQRAALLALFLKARPPFLILYLYIYIYILILVFILIDHLNSFIFIFLFVH